MILGKVGLLLLSYCKLNALSRQEYYLFHEYIFFTLLGYHKTSPSLGDSLEELTELSIWSYSELKFITVKRYKVCTNQQRKRPMK